MFKFVHLFFITSSSNRALMMCLRLCQLLICIAIVASYRSQSRNFLRMRVNSFQPLSSCPSIPEIQFFNTLTRRKEKFQAMNAPKVSFYTCGPTVYDYAHIGNFRAFLTYDLIKRWLQYCGYDVDHVCNLTDVDDKIIVKMISEGLSLMEVTNKYANAFMDDLKVLNVRLADRYPRVTEHIDDIKIMISKLIEKGHAYISNGSVYFRMSSLPDYSRLINKSAEDMLDGAGGAGPNTRKGTNDKEDSRDFVLWKAFQSQDGEVAWESDFGKGRPGWHIECSAMCCKLLGETIDIHSGGIDLVFPHHQNEIVQSEAHSGKVYANYWMHNGFVNINNEKMSKSLKNFKTLRDIAKSPVEARAFRYLVVTSQYRNPLNFSPDTFQSALKSLQRIDKVVLRLKQLIDPPSSDSTTATDIISSSTSKSDFSLHDVKDTLISADKLTTAETDTDNICRQIMNKFEEAMSDDLNTPRAVAELFALVSYTEKLLSSVNNENSSTSSISGGVSNIAVMTRTQAKIILQSVYNMDLVFGLFYSVPSDYFPDFAAGSSNSDASGASGSVPEAVVVLAQSRMEAKKNKQFALADSLRDQISDLGYIVKDKKDGFDLVRK